MTPNRRRTVRWPDSLEGIPHGVLPRKALGGCILEIAREHPRDGRELGTFRHTDFSGKFGLCDFPLFDLILYPLPDSSRQICLLHFDTLPYYLRVYYISLQKLSRNLFLAFLQFFKPDILEIAITPYFFGLHHFLRILVSEGRTPQINAEKRIECYSEYLRERRP